MEDREGVLLEVGELSCYLNIKEKLNHQMRIRLGMCPPAREEAYKSSGAELTTC